MAEKKEESSECECGRGGGLPHSPWESAPPCLDFPLQSKDCMDSLHLVSTSHTMLFTLLSLPMIQTDECPVNSDVM